MEQQAYRCKVTEKAVIARINRKHSVLIRKCKENSRNFATLGRLYTVDASTNCVLDYDIDLEEFARQVGVLKNYEGLANDE
jgi:hypothetical protein